MATSLKIDTRNMQALALKFHNAPPRVQKVGQAFMQDVATGQARAIQRVTPGKQLPNQVQPYVKGWTAGVSIGPTKPRDLVKWLREGTRAHAIVARNAAALHFMWRRREWFLKSVQHPGTRANDFVKKGIKAFEPEFKKRKQELAAQLKRAMMST